MDIESDPQVGRIGQSDIWIRFCTGDHSRDIPYDLSFREALVLARKILEIAEDTRICNVC